ncbi:hypothetical protein FACS1894195_3290 [Bacteroidia bacterium]|nr:hypothetical protein FACS1894195_3290 [Bacteroidia bacterium]
METNFSYQTVSKQVLGDLHTPVSIYLKVRDIYPESALLESSDFHGNENSLSYIALCPLASIDVNNNEVTMKFPDGTQEKTPLIKNWRTTSLSKETQHTTSLPDAINNFLSRFKVEGADKNSVGLFGYTSFNAQLCP